MSASSVGDPAAPVRQARAESYDTEDRGYGWVLFAGTMIALVGTLNVIYGIAAISNSRFFVRDVTYVFSELNTWGWVLLCIGTVQFLAAFAIWAGSEVG